VLGTERIAGARDNVCRRFQGLHARAVVQAYRGLYLDAARVECRGKLMQAHVLPRRYRNDRAAIQP
jgi:hypothetical protein